MGGVLLAYRWLVSQLILSCNLHKQYEHIIFTRPDYLYLCAPAAPTGLGLLDVWVPQGEGYGGFTDRYLAGSSAAVLHALNITQDMVCNVEQYLPVVSQARVVNQESLQAVVWQHMGLSVHEFPFSMFLVRAAGDRTSWSSGRNDINKEVERRNLLVKYPGEFTSAVASCRPANLSATLDAIQQHQVPVFA
jgi:hypothetical protein